MKSLPIGSNAQIAATLLAFAAVLLAFVGVQMDDGPLRIVLVLVIIVLVAAVGGFIGIGLRHQEGTEEAKEQWGKGRQHDDV